MQTKKIERLQLKEQEETNTILWVNTVATIITGVASLVIAFLALSK